MSAKWYRSAVDQLLAVGSLDELESTVAELMKRPPAGYAAHQVTHLVPERTLEELKQHYPGLHTLPNLISAVRRRFQREAPVEVVNQATGELIKLMTKDEAREFVAYIRTQQEELPRRIVDAWRRRAWIALGYKSWDSMCDGEELQLRLPRDERQDIVLELRSAGMSTRAIGSALGADHTTVVRDLKSTGADAPVEQPKRVTSLDGRERPAYQPPRRREPESAAEIARAVNESRRRRLAEIEAKKAGGGAEAGDVRDDHAPSPEIPQPSEGARARHAEEKAAQTSREVLSTNVAKGVWLLAETASMDEAVELVLKDWQDQVDTFPKPTTAERMELVAAFLAELAERWPK